MNSAYSSQVFWRIFGANFAILLIGTLTTYSLVELLDMKLWQAALVAFFIALALAWLASTLLKKKLSQPLFRLSESIEHIASSEPSGTITETTLGSEIIERTITLLGSYTQHATTEQATNTDSSQQTQALFNRLPYPVIGVDHTHSIVFSNTAAVSLLGQDGESINGKPLAQTLTLYSKNNTTPLNEWLNSQQENKLNSEQKWTDLSFTQGNHQTYSFDVWARYVRAEGGGLETLLMLIDRTLEREHEELKVDFVAMAAHDLRSPVTVIRGLIEAIDEELGSTMNAEQKEIMRRIVASGSQLSGFITNILSGVRVDSGNFKPRLEKCDWNAFITNAVDELKFSAQAHGKELKLNTPADLPELAVDQHSMTEVVNNLVGNAIKYSGPNNTLIEISVGLNHNGDVQTTVVDHGVGIPDALVGKLFTKYYRSHRTKKEFGGMGLGLYISKAIIDAHHGQIWAQSKEGEGSTFGFSLPPHTKLADTLDNSEPSRITKGTHGWIKNHSLYRR